MFERTGTSSCKHMLSYSARTYHKCAPEFPREYCEAIKAKGKVVYTSKKVDVHWDKYAKEAPRKY